jgi:inhibitor of KinA
MSHALPYHIYPLGVNALTICFGNCISLDVSKEVYRIYTALVDKKHKHWLDIIPAYSSVSLYFDRAKHENFERVKSTVEEILKYPERTAPIESRKLRIPVCYDVAFGLDTKAIIHQQKISIEEFIALHTQRTYYVFMLGFLPGFAYMGSVDMRIATPRLKKPRTHVAGGSVGIAGEQTGIYPFDSPGGWNIVGKTPLKLFNAELESPAIFQPGDEVKFFAVSKEEFELFDQSYSPVQ